jgi:hypothetical protein
MKINQHTSHSTRPFVERRRKVTALKPALCLEKPGLHWHNQKLVNLSLASIVSLAIWALVIDAVRISLK